MYNYLLIMHKIMSKINIFSLGGLQENGKNLYVIEIDEKLFILDAGLKYPTSELYGVDNIIPDTSFLVENKDRVMGIFLTHGHDDHIGSVANLLEAIDTRVYGSRFTLALVREELKPSLNKDESFVEVKDSSEIKYGNIKIRFYEVAHNIPGSLGIIINTPDGNIIYTGNFTFDQNAHQTDFTSMYESLVRASREGVLALLPESLGALNEGGRGTILEFKQRIENMFVKADGRIIVSLFSNDLQRIQMIVDISMSFGRRVAILGRKTQKIVNLAINMGYLNIPEDKMVNLKFIDDTRKNNCKDLHATVRIVIDHRSQIRWNRCNVDISLCKRCHKCRWIRRQICKLICALCSPIFSILHQLDHTHCGRAGHRTDTNCHIVRFLFLATPCQKCAEHRKSQQQSKYFLHCRSLLYISSHLVHRFALL